MQPTAIVAPCFPVKLAASLEIGEEPEYGGFANPRRAQQTGPFSRFQAKFEILKQPCAIE
jgi:hypothetical protein